jgi:predicted amidophosphoribosyltransferase
MDGGGAVGVRSLETLGVELVLLADYWRTDCGERTDVGWLVHRAKDRDDPGAAWELFNRFSGLVEALAETPDGSGRLLVPVPPTLPATDTAGGRLVDGLARSLAAVGAGEHRQDVVARTAMTPRLRHVDPQRRAEIAAAAGYRASGAAAGRHVVVVDDVILTGSTVAAIAACLREAGAASVTAAVAARTRLR